MFEKRITGLTRVLHFVFAGLNLAIAVLIVVFRDAVSRPFQPYVHESVLWLIAAFLAGGAALLAWIGIKGRYELRRDATARSTWGMSALGAIALFLFFWWAYHPGLENRVFLAVWATFFFVWAAAEAILQRVKHAELNIREKLLDIEESVAELRTPVRHPEGED